MFRLDEEVGTRRDFLIACPNALAASTSCRVTDWWFAPLFSVYAEFAIRKWTAQVPGPEPTQPIWPACWIDTPDRVVQYVRMFLGRSWRLCHMSMYMGFGLRMIGLVWVTFGLPGALVLRRVSFVPIVGLVGLLLVILRCILDEVSCGFVFVVLVAGLLVVPVLVGYIEPVGEMRLTHMLLSILLTLLSLLLYSFVGLPRQGGRLR